LRPQVISAFQWFPAGSFGFEILQQHGWAERIKN